MPESANRNPLSQVPAIHTNVGALVSRVGTMVIIPHRKAWPFLGYPGDFSEQTNNRI
jgi:hypothetical protein